MAVPESDGGDLDRAGGSKYSDDVDPGAAAGDRDHAVDRFFGPVIVSMPLAESLVVALVGGIIGCGAALVVLKVFLVGNLVVMQSIEMPPLILLENLTAAALIGLLGSYIPARSAVGRSVAEALRLVT